MKLLITFLLLLIVSINILYSQQGLKFAELAQRLDPYFAKELIEDIRKQLPQGSDYSIWGYDIGDYSGDGFFDVALSVRLAGEKRKIMQVYMFVDIDGYLTKVAQFPYEFIELPLEIGVVIRNNTCFITRKRKQFNWLIRGYRFNSGSLILLDEYTTTKLDLLTRETYHNFFNLMSTEKYIRTNDGQERFYSKYIRIPSYQRGRQIFSGYYAEAFSNDIDYVNKGAYYWEGEHDASFSVRSSFDQNFIYMTIKINDDNVVIPRCDTCPGDYLDVWFDVIAPYIETGDRFVIERKDKSLKFRTSADFGIYKISFYPGDFLEKKAYVKIGSTDDLESSQKISARNIKVVSSLQESGFILKFKIPFTMLGFDESPVIDDNITELGCTLVYHDFDNPFRPEEETEIASSIFAPLNPSTYGSLLLIPGDMWYGETINAYKDDIVKILLENGF